MRIYTNPLEAVQETERDLYEMGIVCHPQTMQDKDIRGNKDYETLEVRGYSFKIIDWQLSLTHLKKVMKHFFPDCYDDAMVYVLQEFRDRCGRALNPGNSYKIRNGLWSEFLHDGKFSYTYSERMFLQLHDTIEELRIRPGSRQGIITIHSNICPGPYNTQTGVNEVLSSADLRNRGGNARIPCSMYYQVMIREGKLDLIYTMRSCDLLVHFPIDIAIALCLQDYIADKLGILMGTFTYFTGSLHAYKKNLDCKGIF